MGEGTERRITGSLAWRFALHTGLLFAATVAPFFLFDIWTAPPVAFVAAIAVVALWLAVRFLRDRGKPKQPVKITLLHTLYGTSVPIAVGGLIFFLTVEWVLWAYRPITGTAEIWDRLVNAPIGITATLIYPPILFLLLAPRLARENGGPASRFLKGVRARGFGWFTSNWLSSTAGMAGIICLSSVFWAQALYEIEIWRNSDGVVTNWELVAAYPYLPFALLAAAAMLALGNILVPDRETDDAMVRAYIDGDAGEPGPDAKTRTALGVLVAGGCVAALLTFIYPMHLYMTAKGVRDGAAAASGAVEAFEILWNTREYDGWTRADIADAINRYGYWSPDAPEAGLGWLVANSGQVFPENCTVRIAAGTFDVPARKPDSPSAVNEPEPEMKFCIALACTPPFTWNAPPALTLLTSHESQAEGWRENVYADIRAEGRAAAPGGYCTADGRLAETFQG